MLSNASCFRRLLVGHGRSMECETCGLSEWQGRQLTLQIDHIDGDRENNMLSNLRFLCPNCHSLTDTFGSKNSRRERLTDEQIIEAHAGSMAKRGYASATTLLSEVGRVLRNRQEKERVYRVCEENGLELRVNNAPRTGAYKTNWPTNEALESMLMSFSLEEVGRQLGVTGAAVKKRCTTRGIQVPQHRRSLPKTKKKAVETPTPESRRARRMERLAGLHGTRAGYQLEGRLGVERCKECRKANVAATLERRKSLRNAP